MKKFDQTLMTTREKFLAEHDAAIYDVVRLMALKASVDAELAAAKGLLAMLFDDHSIMKLQTEYGTFYRHRGATFDRFDRLKFLAEYPDLHARFSVPTYREGFVAFRKN